MSHLERVEEHFEAEFDEVGHVADPIGHAEEDDVVDAEQRDEDQGRLGQLPAHTHTHTVPTRQRHLESRILAGTSRVPDTAASPHGCY